MTDLGLNSAAAITVKVGGIIRCMEPLLGKLGVTVLSEIIKAMVKEGLKWAKNRTEPEPDIVELKLGTIAEKNIPDTIPADQRQAVVTSLVDLVMPTFEQVVEYNPNIQRIKVAMKKAPAKKAAAKKAAAKKSSYRPGTARKSTGRAHVSTRKTTGRTTSAKETTTKKSAAKKSARQ